MTAGETPQAIEATFRIERARLIAGLARILRDVDLGRKGTHTFVSPLVPGLGANAM